VKLDNKTTPELIAIREALEADPANKNPARGIFLYTAATHRKLDAIASQITHNMIETKKAKGTYVAPDGYSGRKSNRR
jgi:hypothetical protein